MFDKQFFLECFVKKFCMFIMIVYVVGGVYLGIEKVRIVLVFKYYWLRMY